MALHITCLNLFHNLTISEQWSGEMSDCSELHSPGLDSIRPLKLPPRSPFPGLEVQGSQQKKCDLLTTVTSFPFPSFRQTLSSTQGGSGSEGAQLALSSDSYSIHVWSMFPLSRPFRVTFGVWFYNLRATDFQ